MLVHEEEKRDSILNAFAKERVVRKRWVFESLVENDQDIVGLIAYSLYKHRKHLLARNLCANGHTEEEISAQVKIFHDQVLTNGSLDDFRKDAQIYVSRLIEETETAFKEEYDNKACALEKEYEIKAKQTEKECTKLFANEKNKFYRRVKAFEISEKTTREKFLSWLLSGIPGVFASALVTIIIFGIIMMTIPEKKRSAMINDFVRKGLGSTTPINSPTAPPSR